jgi:hypothetical protein
MKLCYGYFRMGREKTTLILDENAMLEGAI